MHFVMVRSAHSVVTLNVEKKSRLITDAGWR
jgi:hypothetical protein